MAVATLYLSQIINKPVLDPTGRPVGLLGDLVVRLGSAFPPVTGLTLRLGAAGKGVGPRATFLHWSQVAEFNVEGIKLATARLDVLAFRRRPGELLLDADLLDQQVIDLAGRKLVRVNDVQLVSAGPRGTDLRLAGIDVGVWGLLRRLGLDSLAAWLSRHTPIQVPDRVIPWEGVEPVDLADLPPELGGNGRPAVKHGLQLTHEKLAALHPSDVAELVEQLSAPDRAAIMESLDAETAAEALGEMEPEMMAYEEDVAGGMMTTDYLALPANLTAQDTIEYLRKRAPSAEEVYYLYVVDDERRLTGVLSLRDLIVAPPQAKLADIVKDYGEVVQVPVDTPRAEVIHVVDKYNLLAVPVTDEAGRLVGVITVDDALAAALPEERRWLPRLRR